LKKHIGHDGRVRSSILMHGTRTSRRSTKDPNQQNFPRDPIIKRVFVAPENHLFVNNDYRNLEVRIAAAKSGDKHLLDAFNSGKDVHSYLGSKAYNLQYDRMVKVMGMPWEMVRQSKKLTDEYLKYGNYRARAKIIWWVLLFGGGPDKVAESAGIPFDEAARLQKVVYSEFPRLQNMFEEFADFADENGYAATDFGRRRYLDGINSTDDRIYSEARRQSLNTPIQGTAADITLRAVTLLDRCWRKNHLRAWNVQEVHDAVATEVHYRDVKSVIAYSRELMESITCPASKGKIKFEVDTNVGSHLGSKLKVNKEIMSMSSREIYELCRKDLAHPPEYYLEKAA
jgi:DNA polymerase-1